MPDPIHYCDACGRLVRPSEIDQGRAVNRGDATFCSECIAKLAPEKQRELRGKRQTPSPVRRATPKPTGRALTPRPPSSRRGHSGMLEPSAKKSANGILIVSAGAGLAVGLLVVVAMMGGDDSGGAPKGAATAVVPAPVIVPVARQPSVPSGFVAPSPLPSPSPRTGPATQPSGDDDEYLELLRQQSEARRKRATETGEAPGAHLTKVAKKWDAAWTLVKTRDDDRYNRQGTVSHLGRDNILVTHPFPGGIPAAMTREVSVPAGSTATLTIIAATADRYEQEDWVLGVVADDQQIGERVVGRVNGAPTWQTFTFDLSRFAGRTVTVRIENRSGGAVPWAWEHAFWAEARIDIR